ncbi:MAG: single-stranded-DNA-specific exonuclease RecJ [Pseudomonadota bacterium]
MELSAPPTLHRRIPLTDTALPAELPPVLRRIYAARGVQMQQLSLELAQLLPPTDLKGVDHAARLLADAIAAQRRIVIAGDYDCDGATGCAVAVLGLNALGAKRVGYAVPDRFKMGYGLSPLLAEMIHADGGEVLVTVDNGIASLAGVARAKALGMTVIVTDHHLPGDQLPPADAIVNPNQPGCGFASKALAGVGVMFYLLLALRQQLRARGVLVREPNLATLLDLVALGTVADLARLDYNNRILVEQGLRRIRAGRAQPGVRALLMVGGREAANISATDLGFVLGPRLNAAGRLEDMRAGIECLLAPTLDAALPLARELDALNRERRALTAQMADEAFEITAANTAVGVCAFDEHWHEGIVGLVATRLKDAHHRPAIAFARASEPGQLKGSARSIAGLNVRDALVLVDARHPGLILRYGGHAMAAGLSIAEDRLPQFAQAFDQVCRECLPAVALERSLLTDGELEGADLALPTAHLLEQAGPWGQGFEEPVFEGRFTVMALRLMGSEQQHVRYELLTVSGTRAEAVHFGGGEAAVPAGSVVQIAYQLGVNRYNGSERMQLRVVVLVATSARG